MEAGGWLSTHEAAQRLGVSEATVRRLSDRGALPVQRVGRRGERRYKVEDVQGFEPSAPRLFTPGPPPPPSVTVAGRAIEAPSHLCAFYDSDASRLRLSAPLLQEGLLAGEPCLLIANGDVLDQYLDRLGRVPGLDLDAAIASRRFTIPETPGRTVDEAVRFWEQALWAAVETGAPVIRAVGEMVSERERFISEAEMLAYEAAISLTLKRFPIVVICQYDVRRFSGQALFSALRAHPDLFSQPLGPFLT